MSEDDKDFDAAFDAAISSDGSSIVEPVKEDVSDDNIPGEVDDKELETGNQETEGDVVPEKTPELSEIEKLQQTIMRQAAAQSALAKELNNAKVVKPKQFAPVIDENGVFTDSFKELQKEFPEADFGRVEKIIRQQDERIQTLTQRFEQQSIAAEQERKSNFLKEQTSLVLQTHPDMPEIAGSQEFKKWQETLTPAELNHVGNAVSADEIRNILNVFKSATGYKSKAALEAESTKNAETTVLKREKRNQAAQGIPTKQQASPATGAVDKLNEDAIFDQVFKNLGLPT